MLENEHTTQKSLRAATNHTVVDATLIEVFEG